MSKMTTTFGATAILTALAVSPVLAHIEPGQSGQPTWSDRMASGGVQTMLTQAAEQMSEDDYAFRPTPEVRTFGQIMAHVADANFAMCAMAKGEQPPVRDIEKTKTTKPEIQKALAESFAYCDGLRDALPDVRAKATVEFMGIIVPAPKMLELATYHNLSHYGNAVVYMRLRGKVPPSSQPGALSAPEPPTPAGK